MGRIEIEGMEFYAFHGHYDVEQVVGNRFLVDLSLDTDLLKASESDQLEDTVNYQEVFQLVKEEMEIKSHLLENVAGRIMKRLFLTYDHILKARIKVSKMNPPLGGQINSVSVTIEKERN
jgi:7,8-dihydroneopterin aldolase/epimerase/oxygenase